MRRFGVAMVERDKEALQSTQRFYVMGSQTNHDTAHHCNAAHAHSVKSLNDPAPRVLYMPMERCSQRDVTNKSGGPPIEPRSNFFGLSHTLGLVLLSIAVVRVRVHTSELRLDKNKR